MSIRELLRLQAPQHEHQWTEVGRDYQPPRDRVEPFTFSGRMNYYNQSLLAHLTELQERMTVGFTTVTYRCDCGRLATDVLLGRVTGGGHGD